MRGTYARRSGHIAARAFAAVCVSVALAGCIGFGVASANNDSDLFGSAASASSSSDRDSFDSASSDVSGRAALSTPVSHDISAGLATIDREQREAEEARIAAEQAAIASAQESQSEAVAAIEAEGAAKNDDGTYTLGGVTVAPLAVDWSAGEQAFVSEWTVRIDAYLAGSPMAGLGQTFAQAAWDYGVDPRFSPAIANTESSKGTVLFARYNAWGWGSSGWSSWEEAVRAHVAGLAEGYGSSLTMGAAQKYCPPNAANWYVNTATEMNRI